MKGRKQFLGFFSIAFCSMQLGILMPSGYEVFRNVKYM